MRIGCLAWFSNALIKPMKTITLKHAGLAGGQLNMLTVICGESDRSFTGQDADAAASTLAVLKDGGAISLDADAGTLRTWPFLENAVVRHAEDNAPHA